MQAALSQLPPSVADALSVVAGVDRALAMGLGRLAGDGEQAMAALFEALAASPLAAATAEASAQLAQQAMTPRTALTIAAARAALLGSVYDALAAQLTTALGLNAAEASVPSRFHPPDAQASALMQSTQQWLHELALSGWQNLSEGQVAPFSPTLDRLSETATLTRLQVLLSGFWQELINALPLGDSAIPTSRWGDLWSRALLLTQQHPASTAVSRAVAGALTPLGMEVRQHAAFAAITCHGLLQEGERQHWVQLTWQAYKVDLVTGHELWRLWSPALDPYQQALQEGTALTVAGELYQDGRLQVSAVAPGSAVDRCRALAEWCEQSAPLLPVAPFDRHPLHLRYPLLLTGIKPGKALTVTVDDKSFPLSLNFQPHGLELDAAALAKASDLIGLWRFEGDGWSIQPLLAQLPAAKKSPGGWVGIGSGAAAALAKAKAPTLTVLQERASKMLRA